MKKIIVLYISVLIFAVALVSSKLIYQAFLYDDSSTNNSIKTLLAENANDDEEEESVPDTIGDLLERLDLSGIQGFVEALNSEQLSIFKFDNVKECIKMIACGEFTADYGDVISYVFSLFGVNIVEYLPMVFSLLAVVVTYSIINSIKGRFLSDAIERIVFFATSAVMLCVVVGYFSASLASAINVVATVKNHINVVLPLLLTLMTAIGTTSSVGIYTPIVVILGGSMTNIVTYIAFPTLLMGLVFDIVGSISTTIKLGKSADFFRSVCKWFLGTAFFLFITVIGVSGITASVKDGVSIRATKFAISKYIPIIGGYLSQGFDFIMAGNVLIKNAIGSTAILLIVLNVAPILVKLIVFTLTLKLTAAISEPLGGEQFSNVIISVSKSSSVVIAVISAMLFLYILFVSMIICTGNVCL